MRKIVCPLMLLMGLSVGCAPKQMADRTAYLAHMPRSVVVLPPLNHTADVGASDAFVATISRPLAERGYYVFPVAIVDHLMKENGVPTPGDMRQVPLRKLGEVFGADAVLYIDIFSWETRYVVLDSSTVVNLSYRLVDIQTGADLWFWKQTVADSSSAGQSNLIGMAVAAAVHQALSGIQRERQLAVTANYLAINQPDNGMLLGPLHPRFDEDQKHQHELQAARPGSPTAGGGG